MATARPLISKEKRPLEEHSPTPAPHRPAASKKKKARVEEVAELTPAKQRKELESLSKAVQWRFSLLSLLIILL